MNVTEQITRGTIEVPAAGGNVTVEISVERNPEGTPVELTASFRRTAKDGKYAVFRQRTGRARRIRGPLFERYQHPVARRPKEFPAGRRTERGRRRFPTRNEGSGRMTNHGGAAGPHAHRPHPNR